MTDDQLRRRLAESAPPSGPVDPVTSDRARALMEDIMSTTATQPRTQPRSYRLVGALVAALILVVGGYAVFGGLGSDPEPLALTAEGGDATASCLPFDVATLSTMSTAFAGTVTGLTDTTATLEVDRWYTSGEAEVVEIAYTPGFEALIGTPVLEEGQPYLITATNGVVNGCGYSGPATPEYEAQFEQAFGA